MKDRGNENHIEEMKIDLDKTVYICRCNKKKSLTSCFIII